MALDRLSVIPMLALVGIGDVAAYARVIVHEHATYAQGNVVGNTSQNRTPIPAFVTRRVPLMATAFLATKQPAKHNVGHLTTVPRVLCAGPPGQEILEKGGNDLGFGASQQRERIFDDSLLRELPPP